CARYYGIAYW
nr:immunoglobulin heavy chain junction region [Mus musculus]